MKKVNSNEQLKKVLDAGEKNFIITDGKLLKGYRCYLLDSKQ